MVRAHKLMLVCGLLGLGAAGGMAFRRTDSAAAETAQVERTPRRWSDEREAQWQARQGGGPALVANAADGAYGSTEALAQAAPQEPAAAEAPATPSDRPNGWLKMRPPTEPPMKVEPAAPPPIPSRASAPQWTADPSIFERRAELARMSPLARLDEPGSGRLEQENLRPLRRGEDEAPAEPAPSVRSVRHRVRDGDTLEALAAHYLGDRSRAGEIFQENRHLLSDPQLLPIGSLLAIPVPRGDGAAPLGTPAVRAASSGGVRSEPKLVPLPPRGQRAARNGSSEPQAQ